MNYPKLTPEQIRADKAYYDSKITDRKFHETIMSEAGSDTIKYLLNKAKEKGLKVHAWMNLLSVARNENANIISKLGKDIITKDQHGRSSLPGKNKGYA